MSKSQDIGNLLAVAAAVAAFVASGGNPLAAKAAYALAVATAVQTSVYQRGKAKRMYNASLTDREAMVATYNGVRSRIYGRARNVDGVVFKGTRGDLNQYYTLVVALAGHEVDAIEQIYLNDQLVTVEADGRVSTEPYWYSRRESAEVDLYAGESSCNVGALADLSRVFVYAETGRGYQRVPHTVSGTVVSWSTAGFGSHFRVSWQNIIPLSKVTIKKYTGAPGQDLSGELQSRFPGLINSAHKFSGIACLLVDLEYDENAFTTGVPNISAVMRGARVYDPRTGTTAWSQNPALCVNDWAQYQYGGDCAADEIDSASVIAAANACDVLHTYVDSASNSSTVPMFRCNYVAKLDVSPETHLAELVESMAGKWAWAGGRLRVRAGTYQTPVAAIDEAWLSNTGGIQVVPEVGVHELINSYRVTIADDSANYNQTELPILAPSAYLTEDGSELSAEIEMGAVTFAPQAQHIAGVMLRDQRDGLTVTMTLNMRAWQLEVFDTVYVSLARYGWVNKAFEVLRWSHAPASGITVALKETGASIFSPDSVFNAGDQIENTKLPKPWDLPEIAGLTAASGTYELIIAADGSIITRVKLTFDPIQNQSVLVGGWIEVGWSDGGDWSYQEFPGGSSVVYLTGLRDGAAYMITARCKNRLASGNWCPQISHTVIGKTEPPPQVDTFTIETQPDGTRVIRGGYTSANRPVDLAGYRIRYRQGLGPFTWAEMTPFQNESGFFTALPIETNQILAGAYTLAIVGVDTTGNESAVPLMISSTLPNPRLGDALDFYSCEALGWPGTLSNGVIDVEQGLPVVRASDQATWATLPSTWAAWTRWVWDPYTSWTYTTPTDDFGAVVQVLPVVTVVAVGNYVVEERHSSDGSTWSAWAAIASPFTARYVQLRVTVTAVGPTGAGVTQITQISSMSVVYTGKVTQETGNDISPAALTGGNRIGVGDIRLPVARSYAKISRVSVTIQSVTGNWSWVLVDKTVGGPRVQIYNASGVLADPPLIDFDVEGVAA